MDSRPSTNPSRDRVPLTLVAPRNVRWMRVRTAQVRIDAGYYEREDVQDLVVNALLNELSRP